MSLYVARVPAPGLAAVHRLHAGSETCEHLLRAPAERGDSLGVSGIDAERLAGCGRPVGMP